MPLSLSVFLVPAGLFYACVEFVLLRLSNGNSVSWLNLLRHPLQHRIHILEIEKGEFVSGGEIVAPYLYIGGLITAAVGAGTLLFSLLDTLLR